MCTGRFSFIETYRLTTVFNATRIVVIDQGIVKEQGTHEELMDLRGKYYHLVLTDGSAPTPNAKVTKREWQFTFIELYVMLFEVDSYVTNFNKPTLNNVPELNGHSMQIGSPPHFRLILEEWKILYCI